MPKKEIDCQSLIKRMWNFINNGGKNLSNKNISKLIKSFQRRFRSELVSGKIDKECFVIAKKLSKLYN